MKKLLFLALGAILAVNINAKEVKAVSFCSCFFLFALCGFPFFLFSHSPSPITHSP